MLINFTLVWYKTDNGRRCCKTQIPILYKGFARYCNHYIKLSSAVIWEKKKKRLILFLFFFFQILLTPNLYYVMGAEKFSAQTEKVQFHFVV